MALDRWRRTRRQGPSRRARLVTELCGGCRAVRVPAGAELCPTCQETVRLGLGWIQIFDRDTGFGAVPANLIASYGSINSPGAAGSAA